MATRTDLDQAQAVLLEKIKAVAEQIEPQHNAQNSASILKTLAEAYAWVSNPNQAH